MDCDPGYEKRAELIILSWALKMIAHNLKEGDMHNFLQLAEIIKEVAGEAERERELMDLGS